MGDNTKATPVCQSISAHPGCLLGAATDGTAGSSPLLSRDPLGGVNLLPLVLEGSR